MKRFPYILLFFFLITSISYSQINVPKKWKGGSGTTYIENNSTFQLTGNPDILKIKSYVVKLYKAVDMQTVVRKTDDGGYHFTANFNMISKFPWTMDIDFNSSILIIEMTHEINIGVTMTETEEQEIRKFQVQQTEKIIKEVQSL